MAVHGAETSKKLQVYKDHFNRLNGYEDGFRASTGQQEMLSRRHQWHTLKSAATLILQNPDGSFIDYIPGLDGPVNP